MWEGKLTSWRFPRVQMAVPDFAHVFVYLIFVFVFVCISRGALNLCKAAKYLGRES